jgi:hypothetical protein
VVTVIAVKRSAKKKEFIILPAEFIRTMTKAFLRCDASLIAHHVWWKKNACLNDVYTEIQPAVTE